MDDRTLPGGADKKTIRVLIVDDSAFMRKMIIEIFAGDADITVVGTARDGNDALLKMAELQPDVITLDVEMPGLNGLDTLRAIMHRKPTPVLMLSSLTQAGAEVTVQCLELGAVDFIGKPSGSISLDIKILSNEVISKVKMAYSARFRIARINTLISQPVPLVKTVPYRGGHERPNVLVIGASTGGPKALQVLVPNLPANLDVPIVIIQHMPPGFTASMANRLDQTSPFHVQEAQAGDRLKRGHAMVAPGGYHLTFDSRGCAQLTEEPAIHGVRPAIDVTIMSLVKLYGNRMVAVLLTGMGRDGARGLKAVFDAGGVTFAEHESTCVVYGMPKAAADLGSVTHQLPLQDLALAVARCCAAEAAIAK